MLSLASKSGGWKFEVGCWTPGKEIDEAKEVEEAEEATQASGGKQGVPPAFFWKCVKRKGFKSFVLKVCESKGFADVFLGKCVNLKSLGGILASFEVFRSLFRPLGGLSFEGPRLTSFTATRGDIPSRRQE